MRPKALRFAAAFLRSSVDANAAPWDKNRSPGSNPSFNAVRDSQNPAEGMPPIETVPEAGLWTSVTSVFYLPGGGRIGGENLSCTLDRSIRGDDI